LRGSRLKKKVDAGRTLRHGISSRGLRLVNKIKGFIN